MKKSSNVKNVQDSLFAHTESVARLPENADRKALLIIMELIENSKNVVVIYKNSFFLMLFFMVMKKVV